MICLAGNLPALQIGRQQVVGYKTDWIEESLNRAAAACGRTDCPFLNDIQNGILHFLEKRCSLKILPIGDLYERMRGMLRKIGCPEIADHLVPLAPPVAVSLIGPARKAGIGFELVFFQLLKDEIELLQDSGAESIRFCDIDESVKLLWSSDTTDELRRQLKTEITTFLESYHRQIPAPHRELHLTLDP
jgi:hypothetical protein